MIAEVKRGLTSKPKTLSPWLFYDAQGSKLFERITMLPEYYPTRTERGIFAGYADGILERARGGRGGKLRIAELGSGTATKTGILLAAAVRAQTTVQYLPVDVSASAMEEACVSIGRSLTGVHVIPQVANYTSEPLNLPSHDGPTLMLYIGSSIGNFDPVEALQLLSSVRSQLKPGDALLLGTDMVKAPATLIAAYNDGDGVTEAFNLNVLRRLNRELGASFDLAAFRHVALWNERQSRIEMHLESTRAQYARIPSISMNLHFDAGERIHTENSYKFTVDSLSKLITEAGFAVEEMWMDEKRWFAVTMGRVI